MSDLMKSFAALIVSIIVVHMIYIGFIRPEAAQLVEFALQQQQSSPRNIVVIIKDYEQEICFILMFWGCFLIASSYREILKTKYLYNVDLIEDPSNSKEAPNDKPEHKELDVNRIIQRLDSEIPQDLISSPLVQTLRASLWRYSSTNNVQNLSDAIESNLEALAVKQDSENSMIRYLIWAIPSIGFIGTVRGLSLIHI